MHIEVKTTNGGSVTPFMLTSNEERVSRRDKASPTPHPPDQSDIASSFARVCRVHTQSVDHKLDPAKTLFQTVSQCPAVLTVVIVMRIVEN